MNKTEKAEMISRVKELINGADAVYLADYSGINVADINNLRNEFRKEGITYKVFKNTLVKRALQETGKFTKLEDHLVGMIGLAFVKDNVSAPAKVIKKYFDASQKLALKGCCIEDQFYDGSRLNELAQLPTKAEVIAGILGSLNSPASGIVGTINAVVRDLVSVIDEIAKKKAA
jgi:large subunit ribosomal protein L10